MPFVWETFNAEAQTYLSELKRLYKCLNKFELPANFIDTLQDYAATYNIFTQLLDVAFGQNLTREHRAIVEKYFFDVRDQLVRLKARHSKQIQYGTTWKFAIPGHIGDILDLTVEDPDTETEDEEMAITKTQLIALASNIINTQYDGNPSGLRSFLDKLEQLKDVMEAEEQTAVNFVKGRLTDSARDCIADSDATIDQIIARLRQSIKIPSSGELEIKLQATSPVRKDRNAYVKEIEDIANLLKRAYISDGLSNVMAEQYSARELKKSITANSMDKDLHTSLRDRTLNTISEVTAAYCQVKQSHEQINMVRRVQGNNRGRGQPRWRGRGRGHYNNNNNYRRNGFDNNRGNFNNNHQNGNPNNNNNNGNRSNNRGRGNARPLGNGQGPSSDGNNQS